MSNAATCNDPDCGLPRPHHHTAAGGWVPELPPSSPIEQTADDIRLAARFVRRHVEAWPDKFDPVFKANIETVLAAAEATATQAPIALSEAHREKAARLAEELLDAFDEQLRANQLNPAGGFEEFTRAIRDLDAIAMGTP